MSKKYAIWATAESDAYNSPRNAGARNHLRQKIYVGQGLANSCILTEIEVAHDHGEFELKVDGQVIKTASLQGKTLKIEQKSS